MTLLAFLQFVGLAAQVVVPVEMSGASRQAAGSPLSPFCTPGLAGNIPCPCSNPQNTPWKGCDNSAGTGGAALSWSGEPNLAGDTVVFTTNGEVSHALTILLQGTVEMSHGVVYGQGIRCVGGRLLRLDVERADSSGHISVPGPGNWETISERSSTLGDDLFSGGVRYYMVYYRDLTVLGGCPSTSTFNSTVAWELDWYW